jgi:hypothetical protein
MRYQSFLFWGLLVEAKLGHKVGIAQKVFKDQLALVERAIREIPAKIEVDIAARMVDRNGDLARRANGRSTLLFLKHGAWSKANLARVRSSCYRESLL